MSRALITLFILLLSTITLSNYVYADNTIGIHIKQIMNMNMKMKATGSVSEASGTLDMNMEGRYLLTTIGKISGEYFAGTFTLECQGLSVQGAFGPFSISTSISPVSTTYSSIPESPTMEGFEQACAVYIYSFNIKLKDFDEWFTNTYGRASGFSPQSFQNISGLPGNIDVKITYGGLTEYKGVPVFKFEADLSGSINQSGYTFGISGKATYFIYTGLYFLLYYDIIIQGSSGMGDSGEVTFSMEMRVETIEHNLPSNTFHAQYEQDDFILIAGGYPNAKIHLKGKQGDSKITAINEGTEPGYVSITYKPKSYKLASPTGEWMMENYILMPGENITINLRVPLSKDLDTYTEAGVAGSSLAMLITLSIILVVIIAVVYIVHWIMRKKTKAPPEVTPQPSPETPPPPSPPPSQQPPPPPPPTSLV